MAGHGMARHGTVWHDISLPQTPHEHNHTIRFNIPNKNRGERQHLLDSIDAITTAFDDAGRSEAASAAAFAATDGRRGKADVCCHFSIAYQYDRTEERTYQHFKSFLSEAAGHGASSVLLVSGSKPRSLDALGCLQRLQQDRQQHGSQSDVLPIEVGVAFNPYFEDPTELGAEKERLRNKVGLLVSPPWPYHSHLHRCRSR